MHFPSNQSNFSISQQTYGVNQISNFKKAVASNHKEAIQKHLSQIKLEQAELNDALMLSLANYKVEQMSNECIFLLLRHKSNPNCEISNFRFKPLDKTTPLITAIKIGQLQAVKTLIDFGARADQCSALGEQPLQIAFKLKGQNFDIIECLLNNMIAGVNVEINKKPVIYLAVEKQFDRVFKFIVEKGADLIFKQQNILHALMKKKFKSELKKKRMINALSITANSSKLNLLIKDRNGKLPQQYETDEVLRAYFQQKFKSKTKQKQKQGHTKEFNKIKELGLHNNDSFVSNTSGKQKEAKKKALHISNDDASFEEIQDDQENVPQLSTTIDEDKQILQARQQEQEERRNEQQKQKNKKNKSTYSLTTAQKKTPKALTKIVNFDVNRKVKKSNNANSTTLNSSNNSNNQLKKKTSNLPNTSAKKKINEQRKCDDESPNNSNILNSAKKHQKKNTKDQKLQKPTQKVKNKKLNAQKPTFSQDQSPLKIRKKTTSKEQKDKKLQETKQANINKIQSCESLQAPLKKKRKYTQQDPLQAEQRRRLLQLKSKFLKFAQKQLSDSSSESQEQQAKTLNQILTQQILQMVAGIIQVTQQSAQSIQKLIGYFQEKIRYIINLDNFDDEPASVQIFLYGSYANDLAVKHSDVDLLVTTSMPALSLIKKLEKYQAFNQKLISEVKFITNTTMPVIKMNYGHFKVDLTFQMRGHTGIRCSQLVRQFLGAQPLIRPLVLVLKTLLNSYGLCDTYTGGIGSYSLTLMTIALLQSTEYAKQQNNLGVLFLEFLLFYGFQMDYVCEAIIIHPPGFAQKPVYSIYQLPNTLDLTPKLIIYDPLNPVNNVGRATYRILALKKIFIVWYNRLQLSQAHLQELMDGSFKQLLFEYS